MRSMLARSSSASSAMQYAPTSRPSTCTAITSGPPSCAPYVSAVTVTPGMSCSAMARLLARQPLRSERRLLDQRDQPRRLLGAHLHVVLACDLAPPLAPHAEA